MGTRLVREGILTSDAVNSLSWAEEVFYRRLMSVVDDFGRFSASPKLLRAACYPLLIDKVSDSDIGKWLSACETAGLVRVYWALDQKRYLEIVKFGQPIRSKSKFPEPVEHAGNPPAPADICPRSENNCLQPKTDVSLSVSVSDSVCEYDKPTVMGKGGGPGEGEAMPEPAKADSGPKEAKPAFDFVTGEFTGIPDLLVATWQEAFPAIDVRQEIKRAAAWLLSNPKNRKSDYRRFLNNWLTRSQDGANGATGGTHAQHREPTIHERRAATIAGLTGRPAVGVSGSRTASEREPIDVTPTRSRAHG